MSYRIIPDVSNRILRDKLELISVDILEEDRALTNELKYLNHSLGFASGWHYLLDWIWTIRHLSDIGGRKFLDAGAGIGLLQWYLALHNAEVLSVDRGKRKIIPFHLLQHFNVFAYTPNDKFLALTEFFIPSIKDKEFSVRSWLKAFLRGSVGALRTSSWKRAPGSVWFYRQDLQTLVDIPDNSVDYIVSISALEHNSPAELSKVVTELERVLKPGGALIATVSAARDIDWYFEPASAWCYTEKTLMKIFGLPAISPSNYAQYDHLLRKLEKSKELRLNMTWYYYYSPRSGMPWGIWRPRYQPVGIIKVKSS